MVDEWAVEKIQKLRLICGNGASGRCKECLRDLETEVFKLSEERKRIAKKKNVD